MSTLPTDTNLPKRSYTDLQLQEEEKLRKKKTNWVQGSARLRCIHKLAKSNKQIKGPAIKGKDRENARQRLNSS